MKYLLPTIKVEVEKNAALGLSLKPNKKPGAGAGLMASAATPAGDEWAPADQGRETLIELTALRAASYCRSGPLMPVTVNVTDRVVNRLKEADTAQEPDVLVTQVTAAPPLKFPVTVAPARLVAPVSAFFTVVVTVATQLSDPLLALVAASRATDAGCTGVNSTGKEYASRLGEPVPAEVTTPLVADRVSTDATPAGVSVGWAERIRAAIPATCGLAMDVPLMVLVAVLEVYQAEGMLLPGANTSTQEPKLE